jgi:hypothetical protein
LCFGSFDCNVSFWIVIIVGWCFLINIYTGSSCHQGATILKQRFAPIRIVFKSNDHG